MAKEDTVPTIWVSVGLTKNLGNYESLRLDAGARMTVDSIDDEEAWKEVWEVVSDQLEARLLESSEALGD